MSSGLATRLSEYGSPFQVQATIFFLVVLTLYLVSCEPPWWMASAQSYCTLL